jgi:hypothetical protein
MSGNSGIGYLVGSEEWARIESIRYELLSFAALGMTMLVSVTVLLNESFVTLWVGREFYGNLGLTAGLCLLAFLRQLVNMEAIALDAMLKLEWKTIAMLVWGTLGIAMAYGFSRGMGLAGVPMGLAVASIGQLFTLQALIQHYTSMPLSRYWEAATRPIVSMALLCGLALFVSAYRPIETRHWSSLTLVGAGVAAATGGAFAIAGVNAAIRATLYSRILGFVSSK